MKLARGLVLALALVAGPALGSTGCGGEENISFSVKYAPGYSNERNAISIFGIFKDGRMSPETWNELGPRFSAALHGSSCEIAIGNELRRSNSALYTAVDDSARSEGITDSLLDTFGPAATGDDILVITIAGRVPKAKDPKHAATRSQAPMMRGGRGRRGAPPRADGSRRGGESEVFEMFASLFAVRSHQSVAMVSMEYRGTSEEEAITKFTEKLTASFPRATCGSWKPEAQPTEEAIRRLPSP